MIRLLFVLLALAVAKPAFAQDHEAWIAPELMPALTDRSIPTLPLGDAAR